MMLTPPTVRTGTPVRAQSQSCQTMVANASSRSAGLDTGIGTTTSPRRGPICSFSTGRTRVIDAGVSANVGSGAYEINVAPGGYSVSYSPDSRHPLKEAKDT